MRRRWSHIRLLAVLTLLCLHAARLVGHEEPSGEVDPANGDLSQPIYGQVCEGGFAGPFPCDHVDLLAYLPHSVLSGGAGNSLWGWTDPLTGSEYALVGETSAAAFVDITIPFAPLYLGKLPTHTSNSTWRDIKVFGNFAFIVSEAPGHGMQVFDLRQLRDVANPPVIFAETTHYAEFGNAHTLALNEDSGFAYATGTNTCSGGLHMVDVRDPLHPIFAGCFGGDGYVHESHCVTYAGPDSEHSGAEICFCSNIDTLTIVDVSNKSSPQMVSRNGYPGFGYTHQTWTTDDHRYLLLDDETDELYYMHNTRTYVFDIEDLERPRLAGTFTAATDAYDHNQYVRGDYVYQANYRAGLRILHLTDLDGAELNEVAYFDVYPANDGRGYNGAWTVFPFFASGTLIVNGIEQGL
ncbi:MAG TPA: choice-of-anchor B family protein, partial [Terriglobales bacterium]|nr:choice-of-anchor B family protein [Terriglobales bacterium]